jgi:DNA-binding SARP family transcriptional activator
VLEASFFGKTLLRLNGHEISLPTKKSLGLIVYLALEGETDRSRLADLFWGKLGTDRARRNLRQELYRLSNSALVAQLELNGERVALKAPFESDVQQFRAFMAAQDFARALEVFHSPLLKGWRFSEAARFEHWLEAERETLAVLRREALAQHAIALEASGTYRQSLTTHLELLADDELQEHHHLAVMRLHAMLGERASALEQFKRLSRILRREVGLEPLPETAALNERILAGEALETHLQTNQVARSAISASPLIEREHLWQQLEQSGAKLIVISGEPGTGKTRLALEFAGSGLVLRGREDTKNTPLAPFAEAIRSAVSENPNALDALERVWRLELARLIPELEAGVTPSISTLEGRSRFLEGLTRATALIAANVHVVLDDLQYFDPSSLEVVGLLVRRLEMMNRKIIATLRHSDSNQQSEATSLLDALEREGLSERIILEPLTESGLRQLVTSMTDRVVTDAAISYLHAATGGNPLHALETLRGAIESGFDLEAIDATVLLPSLHEAVLKRIDLLGASVRRLLEAASVAGNGFELDWLEHPSALTDWEALEALEFAQQARLIEVQVISGETRGYRFAHALVRDAVQKSLSAERKRLVHRKLALALEDQGAASERIALHFERGGQAKRAVPHRIRAAQTASAVFAYREAFEHYALALEHETNDQAAFAIRQARVKLLQKLDDRINWDAEISELERITLQWRDPKLEAVAMLSRADYEFAIGHYGRSAELARSAFRHFEAADQEASHALYLEGMAFFRQSRLTDAKACFEAALELLKDHDFEQLGEIYTALSRCVIDQGDLPAAQMYNDLASNAYHRANQADGEVSALNLRGWIAYSQNELDRASETLLEALERARELGLILLQRSIIINLSAVLVTTGQLERAVPLLEEGLRLAREPQEPRFEAMFHTHLGHVCESRGELQRFLEHFREAIAIFDRVGATSNAIHARLNMTHFFLVCGDLKRAETQLEMLRQSIKATGITRHDAWLEGLSVRCQLLGRQTPKTQKLEQAIIANNKPDLSARLDLARAKLALGDAAETIAIAASLEHPPAIRAESLSLHLQALVALKHRSQTLVDEALKLLTSPEISPINKLSLHQALILTFQHLRDFDRANALRHDAEQLMAQLASNLEPEIRERFTAHWAELLSKNATLRSVR